MTDELKRYLAAKKRQDEATAELHSASVALAARIVRESGPVASRGRKLKRPTPQAQEKVREKKRAP